MCSPSAPKAPPPTPKKPPRVLLSRSQYGDLMIPDTGGAGAGGGGPGGRNGGGGGLGTASLSNFGRNAATGLRINGAGG